MKGHLIIQKISEGEEHTPPLRTLPHAGDHRTHWPLTQILATALNIWGKVAKIFWDVFSCYINGQTERTVQYAGPEILPGKSIKTILCHTS